MNRRVTSGDVARAAGVSRTTVSYILNNTEGAKISAETRQKVLDVAEELGYHMDINAQAMKTNRSMSIGIVSRRNIADSRFANVLRGIKDILAKEKYSILLCSDEVDEMRYPEYYRLYQSKKIDGIIFISCQEQLEIEHADKRVEMMLKGEIPCVFADYHLKNPMVNCVDINYYHGGYITTKYLIEKGYRKIAFLVPDLDTEQERQRLQGVKKAVEETENVALQVYKLSKSSDRFSDDIPGILSKIEKHTALIIAWANLAGETLYHINRMRIEIPRHIAVISLAGLSLGNYTYPRLSACELPVYEMGVKSAQLLMDRMNGNQLPVNMLLSCRMNIQESC